MPQSKKRRGESASAGGVGKSRGITKDAILVATEEALAESGIDGIKIRQIADKLGVQPPAIYHHFTNREAILAALSDKLFQELAEGTWHSDEDESFEEWLDLAPVRLVQYFFERPSAAQCMLWFTSHMNGSVAFGDSTLAHEVARTEELRNALKKSARQKKIKARSLEMVIGALYGATAFATLHARFTHVDSEVSMKKLQSEARDLLRCFVQR